MRQRLNAASLREPVNDVQRLVGALFFKVA
jgi:hypothetical protein